MTTLFQFIKIIIFLTVFRSETLYCNVSRLQVPGVFAGLYQWCPLKTTGLKTGVWLDVCFSVFYCNECFWGHANNGACVCMCAHFIEMNIAGGTALSILIKEVEGSNETLLRGMMSTQRRILITMLASEISLGFCLYVTGVTDKK